MLGEHGLTMAEAITPHPLCCPARAEILTGQMAQNNGVRTNFPPQGGYAAFDPSSTIGTDLSQAGYNTAFLGKPLNGYDKSDGRDPGWTIFNATSHGYADYYDFIQFEQDRKVEVEGYYTDYLARQGRGVRRRPQRHGRAVLHVGQPLRAAPQQGPLGLPRRQLQERSAAALPGLPGPGAAAGPPPDAGRGRPAGRPDHRLAGLPGARPLRQAPPGAPPARHLRRQGPSAGPRPGRCAGLPRRRLRPAGRPAARRRRAGQHLPGLHHRQRLHARRAQLVRQDTALRAEPADADARQRPRGRARHHQ